MVGPERPAVEGRSSPFGRAERGFRWCAEGLIILGDTSKRHGSDDRIGETRLVGAKEMAEPSSQDKWGELARTLGAEVRDEPVEPPPTTAASKPRAMSARPPAEPPRRPVAGWDELIGEFGLPAPPAEPPKMPAVPPSVALPSVAPAARPKAAAPPVKPRPAKVERKEEPPQRGREGRPASRAEKPARVERAPARPPRPPAREERPPARVERAEPAAERAERPPQKAVPAKVELPPVEPPRSAYGLPDWFPFARKRSEAPAAVPAEPEPQPFPLEDAAEEEAFVPPEAELEQIEIADEETEMEDGEPRKGKRRRPRRRRRGGKSKEEGAEAPRAPRAKAASPPESIVVDLGPAGHDVELFEEDEEDEEPLSVGGDDEDEGEEEAGGRGASHRNIPSWAEAIGVVVDANLAMRTERKKTAHAPGAGRGGRPRGRRKKRS